MQYNGAWHACTLVAKLPNSVYTCGRNQSFHAHMQCSSMQPRQLYTFKYSAIAVIMSSTVQSARAIM